MTGLPRTTGALVLQILNTQAGLFLEQQQARPAGADTADGAYDPEPVHQMRVATRRMRAALRLFGGTLPAQASQLNTELKWIAGQLGTARDLDVQLQRLRQTSEVLGLAGATTPYAAWLDVVRQRAQYCLDEALGSPRMAALLQMFSDVSTEWSPNPETDVPLQQDAPETLARAYKSLEKRADAIDDGSPVRNLHAVRIRAKRVRYAAEFYEPAYDKPARRLVERLVELQDLLGSVQDGVVSSARIHEAVRMSAEAWPTETSLALGQLLQHDAQRTAELRKDFPHAYKRVKASWKRLRRDLR